MRLFVDPVATSCRPVLATIQELGLPVDVERVSLAQGEHLSPDFRRRNPTGKVPYLQDASLGLGESAAIARYLCEGAGSDLAGGSARSRAKVDERLHWNETVLAANFSLGLVYPRFVPALAWADPIVSAAVQARCETNTRLALDYLDRAVLSNHPHVAGETFSIADYFVLSVLELAPMIDFDLKPYPAVAAWMTRTGQRPAWRAVSEPFRAFLAAMA